MWPLMIFLFMEDENDHILCEYFSKEITNSQGEMDVRIVSRWRNSLCFIEFKSQRETPKYGTDNCPLTNNW